MIYSYYCPRCKDIIEKEFPFGEAKGSYKCKKCKLQRYRQYNFSVSIPTPTSEARRGRGKG